LIDSGLKIDAATPGLSFTPTKVTFASLCVEEIPVIILLLFKFVLFVINVPGFFINEDFTSILIWLFLLKNLVQPQIIIHHVLVKAFLLGRSFL